MRDTTIKIDTLKFARQLNEAGMHPRQVETIVERLPRADTSDLAIKRGIGVLNSVIVGFRS